MQKRTIRTFPGVFAAAAMALVVPGVVGVGAASAIPLSGGSAGCSR
ncbi:hypothetical protein [Tsukamurella tyrosinosolvens]|nr:hypothetical protein [Tsukamurella tyrosinosolvens]